MRFAVYGTLRKGFGNHHYLEGATFVGKGVTKDKYTLRARGIPFVGKTPRHNVTVEVYDVSDERMIRDIDALEGHPQWYKREEIPVILQDGSEVMAWLYFMESNAQLVEDGDYETYRKTY